jgi:hypothetical protein
LVIFTSFFFPTLQQFQLVNQYRHKFIGKYALLTIAAFSFLCTKLLKNVKLLFLTDKRINLPFETGLGTMWFRIETGN